ncbi:LysM peptidoglycan-binding domain-containing protein, partial [Streptococcus pneumoniae]|nr:LysM peptidoglycan-binding domain-containing protein [Streptococcus pneumoniae]
RAQAEEKEKEEQQETPTAGGKTVTVQSSETLYRIAVNNYGASGAAAAVEKIKQANGLASNDISPGQTLILP